jgi:hypothetical protein
VLTVSAVPGPGRPNGGQPSSPLPLPALYHCLGAPDTIILPSAGLMMPSKFSKTLIYEELIKLHDWFDAKILNEHKKQPPNPIRLKDLMLEREAVKVAQRALDQW